MVELRIKRVYEPPAPGDGKRILVDRLWPRGLKRETARIDDWIKDAAPSHELRRWFAHDPAKWDEFRRRYIAELRHNDALAELRRMARSADKVTLLFAAKDCAHNNAVVLRDVLDSSARDARGQ